MEQKAEMKKRGVRSPDESDSLCLTFAIPPASLEIASKQSEITKSIAQDLNRHMAAKRSLRNLQTL